MLYNYVAVSFVCVCACVCVCVCADDPDVDPRDVSRVEQSLPYVAQFIKHNRGNVTNAYSHMVRPVRVPSVPVPCPGHNLHVAPPPCGSYMYQCPLWLYMLPPPPPRDCAYNYNVLLNSAKIGENFMTAKIFQSYVYSTPCDFTSPLCLLLVFSPAPCASYMYVAPPPRASYIHVCSPAPCGSCCEE